MARTAPFIEGLEELREALEAEKLSRKTVLGMAKAVEEVHKVLQDEVFARYGFRKKLHSVRVGATKDIRYLPGARERIEQDLVYEGPSVPLAEFNHRSIFDIQVPSAFHASYYSEVGIFERKAPLERVQVSVLRNEGMKNLNSGKVRAFTIGGNIVSRRDIRKKNPTQKLFSPEYTRTDIKTLYGPSLPEAAGWVLENNSRVQEQIARSSDIILEELTRPG